MPALQDERCNLAGFSLWQHCLTTPLLGILFTTSIAMLPSPPLAPIKVLIVDDHPLLREGIAAVLGGAPDIEAIGEAANGREAISQFWALRPDLVLMDLQMPVMNGVEAIEAIRGTSSAVKIIVLTTFQGDMQVLRALKSGADGYLLKNALRTELIDVVRSVHAGARHISHDVAEELAAHVTHELLSPREIEVLQQIATGNSNKRIAEQLSIAEDTVKAHVKNIMAKLYANDRTHAVTIALKRGIILMP